MENVEGDKYKIPKEFYRIIPWKDIQMMTDKGENLPDIVAQLSFIRALEKVDKTKSPPKSSFNLILPFTFESGETALVSVWEKLAIEASDTIAQLQRVPIVVIVTGVNPRNVRAHIFRTILSLQLLTG